MDMDVDSDEESRDLNDLQHLTAVLGTEPGTSGSIISRSVVSTASTSNSAKTTSTEHFRIESALALNRLYDEKLARLEKILGSRLNQCRTKLKQIQGMSPSIEKQETFRYVYCGKPYFRDKSNFPAPDNEDAIMIKSQMYDFTQIISVPGWTVRDKTQFISMITKMTQDVRKKELLSKIAALKRKSKVRPNKTIAKEISSLEQEINNIKKKSLRQIALPLDEDYDWDMLANRLNRRHTAQEYQALWKLFFHPSINKDSWTREEQEKLHLLSHDHNNQDWETIAMELRTGRTGYQCFVYFRTNSIGITTGQRWTKEEVTYLKRLIDYFRQDSYIPWGKIAAAMENRSKIQIYNKYLRLIEQRKGRFLPAEDAVILNCVANFGPNFKKMTNYLPGRSSSQLRTRYQVLSNTRISTIWTVEDDRKLMQVVRNQDIGMNFSEAANYFPGKNRVNIRSRYITLKKWIQRHPYADLEFAPRRGARRLNHGSAGEDLDKALENLKNTLKQEAATKSKNKRITLNSTEFEIEDAIVSTLINEKLKNDEAQRNANWDIDQRPMYIDQYEPNDANLVKSLIFLDSKLDKEKYDQSVLKHQYPELSKSKHNVSLRVKSYSRKETITSVKMHGGPTVWGDYRLVSRGYVLPPHYATITGCRSLMGHVSTMRDANINLGVLFRKNTCLQEQYNILQERFITLFLWPMLLSNKAPEEHKDIELVGDFFKMPAVPTPPSSLSINFSRVNKRKVKPTPSKGIDLEDCDSKSDINIKNNLSDIKMTLDCKNSFT